MRRPFDGRRAFGAVFAGDAQRPSSAAAEECSDEGTGKRRLPAVGCNAGLGRLRMAHRDMRCLQEHTIRKGADDLGSNICVREGVADVYALGTELNDRIRESVPVAGIQFGKKCRQLR